MDAGHPSPASIGGRPASAVESEELTTVLRACFDRHRAGRTIGRDAVLCPHRPGPTPPLLGHQTHASLSAGTDEGSPRLDLRSPGVYPRVRSSADRGRGSIGRGSVTGLGGRKFSMLPKVRVLASSLGATSLRVGHRRTFGSPGP